MERKSALIAARVTGSEGKWIRALAELRGMTVSELVREIVVPAVYHELGREIRGQAGEGAVGSVEGADAVGIEEDTSHPRVKGGSP